MAETLVLLHGFGGTHRAWDGVVGQLDKTRYRALALDLPGHGEAAGSQESITFEACVGSVLAASPNRVALCGYSLGGRIALRIALEAPERLSRLILVSSSAGIEDDAERRARRAADRRLADRLEREPFEDFIEFWCGQALFAADPPEVGRLARQDYRRNQPRALARVMRAIGTGEMEPLWDRLGEISVPVTIVVGDRDRRFCAIAERMAGSFHDRSLAVIPGGHRLPLESPAEVAEVLNRH